MSSSKDVPSFTIEGCARLTKSVTIKEVYEALECVQPFKSPRVDGFQPFSSKSIGILWVSRCVTTYSWRISYRFFSLKLCGDNNRIYS